MDLEYKHVRKNKKPFNSFHESWGVIFEEVDEYWDEVKKKKSARDRKNALHELVQIATACQRAAEDLLGDLLE